MAEVFLGIPYARAPVGGLRFKKPIAYNIDDYGDFNATQIPSPCVNYINGQSMPWSSPLAGAEDCLYLNIWSPNISGDTTNNKLYPVMVWIYGGGFQTGSVDLDLYDGQTLATIGDVVVVTFNYRTGIFGLFYADSDDAPGNLVLHDQRMAIQWVSDHIDRFGGDPELITVFGESAGSISAGVHLLSPNSSQLFKRAILQSGSPYHNIGGVSPHLALKQSRLIARDAGCLSDEQTIDFNCMRNMSSLEIMNVYKDIYSRGIALQLIFGDEISAQHPIQSVNQKQVSATDLLLGTNRNEGSAILFMGVPDMFDRNSPLNITKTQAIGFIRAMSEGWWLGVLSDQQLRQITDFYMSVVGEEDYSSVRQSLVDIIGDSMFICPSVYLADGVSTVGGAHVYYYQFTHIKHFDNYWGQWMGSPHFDEVQYVFGLPHRYPHRYSEPEIQLSTNLMKSWSSFARNG
ncbi:unnamed protein product [Medioppia subpectinata]|uniref:Carboxylic ester hydrolase n=1 Tax=Medioppia subpectinata TaxID=1979941 RepID=A0A7R9Q4V9_9ACAR|nr:unnamed protein product [Medioppia subpectinata]CAG2112674.1 unnamed protein product [Medioppia subpectinata]